MNKEYFDIYDENKNKTGKIIEKHDYEYIEGEYNFSIHLWIKNNKNEYLMQQRTKTDKSMPNKWSVVTGGVQSGEEPKQAAIREAKEELGVSINVEKLQELNIIKRDRDFVFLFLIKENFQNILMQKEEVQNIKYMDDIEIEKFIRKKKIAPSIIDKYKNIINKID